VRAASRIVGYERPSMINALRIGIGGVEPQLRFLDGIVRLT
jgi:hypothetical protein